jgi:Mycobacterium membrane protein
VDRDEDHALLDELLRRAKWPWRDDRASCAEGSLCAFVRLWCTVQLGERRNPGSVRVAVADTAFTGADGEKSLVQRLRGAWIPLLLVVVVGLGAYAVVRIRTSLGLHETSTQAGANSDNTKPFNPKHIVYEVTGAGGRADIDYLDENGQPHRVDDAPLPWSFTIVTTLPSMSANIVAQGDKRVAGLGCRVVVDGKVRDDRHTNEYQPFIYCLVKSV